MSSSEVPLRGSQLRPTAADGRCREVDWARAEIPGEGKGIVYASLAKSCLAPSAECSLPLWVSHPPTGTIPISGAPSQSLWGASFKAFEPKRGWQFGSSRAAKDDLGWREAVAHENRDGRLAQIAREYLDRVSQSVKVNPHFLHLAHSFCRAARGRW